MKCKDSGKFFGATTVGEKGQVVIPVEARKAFKIESTDKLLVFGIDEETIILTKPSKIQTYTKQLAEKLTSLQDIMEKNQ